MYGNVEADRKELVTKVCDSLEKGVIPWQQGESFNPMPESATSGNLYKGVNALILSEAGKAKEFEDSRWITFANIKEMGLSIKAGEKSTRVEYLKTDGGQRGVYSYPVFNVEQLNDYEKFGQKSQPVPAYDKADAILKNAGAEIPQERDVKAYAAALEKAVADAGKTTAIFSEIKADHLKDLRTNMAGAFISRETNIPITPAMSQKDMHKCAESFSRNPNELFSAAHDAEKLVGDMTQGLEKMQSQSSFIKKEAEKPITPQKDDRVTFVPKLTPEQIAEGKAAPTYTGKVVGLDDEKGTVTMKCGEKDYTFHRGKGEFYPARPLPLEATKEYAQDLAKKHVAEHGENGKVYFAGKEGSYKGAIVETTPTYALQETRPGTVILHRLKDLRGENGENKEFLQKGQNLSINKKDGQITVKGIEQTQQQAQSKAQGQGR
jgi:antirestriction protein ArdC